MRRVTTNPSLIKKAVEGLRKQGEEIRMADYIESILKTVDGPVSLEVVAREKEQIIRRIDKI